jgi:integrase
MMRELKAHRLRTRGEFLFPIDERNWRSRVWHPALRRAGLRSIRVHDARHSCASMLIAAGVDVVEVARILGHSKPTITLSVYSHAFERRATGGRDSGERLEEFMAAEVAA